MRFSARYLPGPQNNGWHNSGWASKHSAGHIKQSGQGTLRLSPYFSAPLPTVSQASLAPLRSDYQPAEQKQAGCLLWAVKTRLVRKYSGLFHHLLIVLLYSPRHHTRRDLCCKNTNQQKTCEIKWRKFEREQKQSSLTLSEHEHEVCAFRRNLWSVFYYEMKEWLDIFFFLILPLKKSRHHLRLFKDDLWNRWTTGRHQLGKITEQSS